MEKLVALANASDTSLRLNSIWALKNLLFQADSEIKRNVMKVLTYPRLRELVEESEVGLQEQALNLLRNLACGKQEVLLYIDGIGHSRSL